MIDGISPATAIETRSILAGVLAWCAYSVLVLLAAGVMLTHADPLAGSLTIYGLNVAGYFFAGYAAGKAARTAPMLQAALLAIILVIASALLYFIRATLMHAFTATFPHVAAPHPVGFAPSLATAAWWLPDIPIVVLGAWAASRHRSRQPLRSA